MKLEILGSGGGEGYPAAFCGCDHCNAARKAGGKSLRSLSQSCIDRELMIDLPADTHAHTRASGINLGEIENLLITHTHADHYIPQLFDIRAEGFAHKLKYKVMNVIGNSDVKAFFDGVFAYFPISPNARDNLNFIEAVPLHKMRVGRYDVTPLHANHALEQLSLNYIIEDGKSSLLYLIDSGLPLPETMEYLASLKRSFDCVVMDGTMGNCPLGTYPQHMGFAENVILKEKLLECGSACADTRFIVTHITHNHAGLHEEIEKTLSPHGILTAYDGMTVEF